MVSRLRNHTGPAGTVDRREVRSPATGLELSCDFSVHCCWQDFWFSPIVPQKSKFFSWLSKQARARWNPNSIKSASQHSPGRNLEDYHLDFSTEIPRVQRRILPKKPSFSTKIGHFSHEPHPSRQSDNAALVLWSRDERWARRVVTVLSVDFKFEIWDLRFKIYSTDESGRLN